MSKLLQTSEILTVRRFLNCRCDLLWICYGRRYGTPGPDLIPLFVKLLEQTDEKNGARVIRCSQSC